MSNSPWPYEVANKLRKCDGDLDKEIKVLEQELAYVRWLKRSEGVTQ